MKKTSIFYALAATVTMGFVACNSDGSSSAASENTTTEESSTATTNTSTGSYAAQADSYRINSEQGHYLDARTGKAIRIKVDPSTGARVNEETGEPIGYYVDKRTWWVYGDDSWDSIGEARMENDELRYRGDGDKWVTFDEKWKIDEGDGEMKHKTDSTKTKIEKDGDIKMKTEDGTTIKSDEDGVKVKPND